MNLNSLELDLSCNYIDDKRSESLASIFKNHRNLTYLKLNLESNSIEDEGAVSLSSQLS